MHEFMNDSKNIHHQFGFGVSMSMALLSCSMSRSSWVDGRAGGGSGEGGTCLVPPFRTYFVYIWFLGVSHWLSPKKHKMLEKLKEQIPSKMTHKYWNVNVKPHELSFGIMSVKSMVLSSPQGVAVLYNQGLSLQQICKKAWIKEKLPNCLILIYQLSEIMATSTMCVPLPWKKW